MEQKDPLLGSGHGAESAPHSQESLARRGLRPEAAPRLTGAVLGPHSQEAGTRITEHRAGFPTAPQLPWILEGFEGPSVPLSAKLSS